MAELTGDELRERVRERYGHAATRFAERDATGGCACGCDTAAAEDGLCCTAGAAGTGAFGAALYAGAETDGAPAGAVDVVVSNCVINLAADKQRVLREAARVLRPGGSLAVSDVIADPDMDAAARADMATFTGCVAGALTRADLEHALAAAGFVDVDIRQAHRVHEHAASAIIRAHRA